MLPSLVMMDLNLCCLRLLMLLDDLLLLILG